MSTVLHKSRWLFGIVLVGPLLLQSHAQDDLLFANDEPLAIVFEMPMDVIIKDAEEKPVVDGVMRYTDVDGSEVAVNITMTTRGRSRLEYCLFPPLKLNIKKKQAQGILFTGQNKLKIVTLCRTGSTHERYLLQEFGIYKAYNELTDFSFRVRWLNVTYKDSAGKRDDRVHDAFFLESGREVAARHNRERVMQNRIPSENLDPVESSRYALFQYLIANTDWSMIKGPGDEGCCHNGKILRKPGSTENWVVLPYDFDQAGLIDTKYSIPAEGLRIRSVTQRLYRGRCRHNGQLADTIAYFNERRPALERYLVPEGLSNGDQRKATKYVDAFFATINDPKKRQRALYEACVGT
jgi:hypothetical protein